MKRPWMQYRLWHLFLATTLVSISLKIHDVWNHQLERIVEKFNAAMETGEYDHASYWATQAEQRYPDHIVTAAMVFKAAFAQYQTTANDPFSRGFECYLNEPILDPIEWEAWKEFPTRESNSPLCQ